MTMGARRRLGILLVLFLAWLVGQVDRVAISTAIVPIALEFSLDARQMGYVLSIFYVSYAAMQLIGGWLAHRFGAQRILLLCVLAWSVFTGLTGVVSGLVMLLVVRFLFGLGEGGFAPSSSAAVAQLFPLRERARAKSFLISSTLLGGALGSAAVAAAITQHGWRHTYLGLGILGVMVVTLMAWVMAPGLRQGAEGIAAPAGARVGVGAVVRIAMVRHTMALWFLSNVGALALQSWMPTYLMREFGVDLLHAGLMAAVPYVLAFLGLNVVGWLLDRTEPGRERGWLVGSALVMVGALAGMALTRSVPVLMMCWVLSTLAYNFIYAIVFAIPLRHLPTHLVGSATGLINFGGQLAGAVGPALMGVLVAGANGSFAAAFGSLLAIGIAVLGVALFWKPGQGARAWRAYLPARPSHAAPRPQEGSE